MIGGLGAPELILVLIIVIILFGVGRITKIAGELGSGIKAFKDGLSGSGETGEKPDLPKEQDQQDKT